MESNILHNVAGYIIASIFKKSMKAVCENCIPLIGRFKPCMKGVSKLTALKCYKEETLFFVTRDTFKFFLRMECIFRTYFPQVCNIKSINLHDFFVEKFSDIAFELPDCCNMKLKMVKRFASFRLKIKSQKLKKPGKYFASKSMAMHYGTK